MAFTVTSNGLIMLEEFTRGDSPTIGNGWEDLGAPGDHKIETNKYNSNGANVSTIYQESDTYALPAGDTIFQFNTDFSISGAATLHFGIRSNEKAVGAAAKDLYLGILKEGLDYEMRKVVNNALSISDYSAHSVSNDIRTQRMVLADNGGSHVVSVWQSNYALTNLQDMQLGGNPGAYGVMTKYGEITDAASPLEIAGGYTDFFITSITHMHHDNVVLCGRGITVTGLPTGYKVSIDLGTTKVTESGGSATMSIDSIAIPLLRAIRVYNASDVLQDVDYVPSDVYGGASVAWSGASSAIVAGVPTGIDVGLNFRSTEFYVTDGANEYWPGAPATKPYPTTIGGVTMGWDNGWDPSVGTANRDAAVDRRLAGDWSKSNVHAVANVFRIDLPNGEYDISFANGSTGLSQTRAMFTLLDGVTDLIDIDEVTGTAINEYMDASDVLRTEAAWPGDNVTVRVTVSTGILRLRLGGEGGGTGTSRFAHLRLVGIAPVIAPVSGGTGGTGGATRGLILRRRRRLYT